MHRTQARIAAAVIAGGDAVDPADLEPIPPDALVIAADSGVERALALGLRVDIAVGDFDSIAPAVLDAVALDGTVIERHPTAKDSTDLELALDTALASDATDVLVVGGHGGRLDHFLANAALLASPRYERLAIVAQMGPARVTVVRSEAALHGAAGALVTLLAFHGPATGVTTEGLRYPLAGEVLEPGSTRGVSNVFVGDDAVVRLERGVLLAVQPGA